MLPDTQSAAPPPSSNLTPEMQQALDIAHAATKQSQGSVTPQQTKDPAAKIQPALGLNPSDVAPGTGGANLETKPMPSTNPAGQVLGLGETDVAPGNPIGPKTVMPPSVASVPPVAAPSPTLPVVGQTPIGPNIPGAVNMGSQNPKAADPVKDASSQPGFWDKVLSVAGSTGKSILELLGDIGAGATHQEGPTQQRLQREQQLRLQGNEIQRAKDMQSIQNGFQQQQAALDRELTQKMATAAGNPLQSQQINNEYLLRKQEIANNLQIALLNYGFSSAMRQQGSAAQSFYGFPSEGASGGR